MRRLWIAAGLLGTAALATPAAAQRVPQGGRMVSMPSSGIRTIAPRPTGGGSWNRPAPQMPRPTGGNWNRPTTPRVGGDPRSWSPTHNGGSSWSNSNSRSNSRSNSWSNSQSNSISNSYSNSNSISRSRNGHGNVSWSSQGGGHGGWGNGGQGHGGHGQWQNHDGRWQGGWQAPGGWGNYHRMGRGGHLDGYWMRGDFRINDYLRYGLASPPYGYFWTRYYDDAVLADAEGNVWDSVSGIGWDGDGYADGDGYDSDYQADYGYGGAAVATAYAGAPYAQSGYYGDTQGGYAPPVGAPPAVQSYGACQYGCAPAGRYYQGGYYYPAPTVTTVVIQSAPVVTTTTTVTEEVIEGGETVSTWRAPSKRVIRRPTKLRPRCGC